MVNRLLLSSSSTLRLNKESLTPLPRLIALVLLIGTPAILDVFLGGRMVGPTAQLFSRVSPSA